MFSITKPQARRPITAPIWLRTIAPTPTPIAPQIAGARDRAEQQPRDVAVVERERDVPLREADVADPVRERHADGTEDHADDEAREELGAEDARPARRHEEGRADRPEAVLARQDEDARERGEDSRDASDAEQLALVLRVVLEVARVLQEPGQERDRDDEHEHAEHEPDRGARRPDLEDLGPHLARSRLVPRRQLEEDLLERRARS